jgi:hypothetical protein
LTQNIQPITTPVFSRKQKNSEDHAKETVEIMKKNANFQD